MIPYTDIQKNISNSSWSQAAMIMANSALPSLGPNALNFVDNHYERYEKEYADVLARLISRIPVWQQQLEKGLDEDFQNDLVVVLESGDRNIIGLSKQYTVTYLDSTGTTKTAAIPAAAAASRPLFPSSKTRHSAAGTPMRSAARRNISGAGFPLATSLGVMMMGNRPSSPVAARHGSAGCRAFALPRPWLSACCPAWVTRWRK